MRKANLQCEKTKQHWTNHQIKSHLTILHLLFFLSLSQISNNIARKTRFYLVWRFWDSYPCKLDLQRFFHFLGKEDLNNNPFQMIQFMLANLSRKSCQGNGLLLPMDIPISHGNLFISSCRSDSCQRQTSFLCLVWTFKGLENRIKHDHGNHSDIKNNDAFLYPNHIDG